MASELIAKGRRGLAKAKEPDPAAPPQEKQKTTADKATGKTSISAGEKDGAKATEKAAPRARAAKAKVAKRPPRRLGRPRGPDREKLSIRILAENDARLTAAVEATGQSPQYIVDAALAMYFDHIGIPTSESAG